MLGALAIRAAVVGALAVILVLATPYVAETARWVLTLVLIGAMFILAGRLRGSGRATRKRHP